MSVRFFVILVTLFAIPECFKPRIPCLFKPVVLAGYNLHCGIGPENDRKANRIIFFL